MTEDIDFKPIDGPEDDAPEQKQSICKHCSCPRGKMHSFNWLEDIPGGYADSDMVEVLFKNTRKGYYKNSNNLHLEIGDMVAVEASPGHDIGRVNLVGDLVKLQMRKANIKPGTEIKRIFRKAKPADLEKYEEACAKETDTMIRARKIASSLNLNMKIGDVEYQGDGNKAIFYYIADERVDFRQLIKVLAETFRIKIEMKQIGARQEAGRIGGIGPCGRPLCCSSWMSNFVTVATSAARFQDISLNPQKLAGQCAKLKCCLNFEVDTYVESMKGLPPRDINLETADSTYYHFKTDIFKREITYSTDKVQAVNLVTITAERAFEVIAINKEGQKPLSLLADSDERDKDRRGVHDILDDGDLTRFDKKKKKKKKGQQKGDQQGHPKAEQPGEHKANSAPMPEPKGDSQPEAKPEGNEQNADKSGEQPKDGGRQQRRKQWHKNSQQKGKQGPKPNKPNNEAQQ